MIALVYNRFLPIGKEMNTSRTFIPSIFIEIRFFNNLSNSIDKGTIISACDSIHIRFASIKILNFQNFCFIAPTLTISCGASTSIRKNFKNYNIAICFFVANETSCIGASVGDKRDVFCFTKVCSTKVCSTSR